MGAKRESGVTPERARRCNRGRKLQYATEIIFFREGAVSRIEPQVRKPA